MSIISDLIDSKSPEEWIEFIGQYSSKSSLALACGLDPRSTQAYRLANKLYELYPDAFENYTYQGWNKNVIDESLFKNGVRYSSRIRLAFLKVHPNVCDNCGLTDWLGYSIPFEVHHLNGDRMNNDLSNLQLLCPNCHALTDNFRGKGHKDRIDVSDEELINYILSSSSIREVLLKANIAASGWSYNRVRKLMSIHNLELGSNK